MFEKLFDLLVAIWEWLVPFQVVDIYERGIILRWGKPKRELNPGFRWMWPLGIEDARIETVVLTTSYLDVQSLTSLDGKAVAISGIITYRISDVKKYALAVDEPEDVVHNIVYGVISDNVEIFNWDVIRKRNFNISVFDKCVELCDERVGVEILEIQWSDKSIARNLRLWND